MSAAVVFIFDETEPFTVDKLNSNFRQIMAAVNALAGDSLLVGSVASGGEGEYVPVAGGAFLGQVSAPSMVIGPPGGTQYLVVTQGTLATPATPGAVRQIAASADTAGDPGATYSQAEMQAVLDELRDLKTKARAAGVLAP